MIRELLGKLWMAAALLGLPAMISRYGLQSSWLDIGKAFLVLAAICLVCGVTAGETWNKRFMWAAILGMIAVIPGVPLLILIMRLTALR